MAHGANSVFNFVIASGVSTSTGVDLGRGWKRVYLDATGLGANCYLQGAPQALGVSGSYRNVMWPAASSGSAGAASFTTAISGSILEVPLCGLRFVKVVSTATVANGFTGKLICADN